MSIPSSDAPAVFGTPNLPLTRVFPQDWEQFLIVFSKVYTDIAFGVNTRELGYFLFEETLTGKSYPPTASLIRSSGRPTGSYRTVYLVPATAAGATATIPHGLTTTTPNFNFTQIFGTCKTAVPDWRPIPFSNASAATNQIEIEVDPTNIYVVNGSGSPNLASGLVVLEYVK